MGWLSSAKFSEFRTNNKASLLLSNGETYGTSIGRAKVQTSFPFYFPL